MQNDFSDNQRQSYRYPISEAQKDCTLRIGEQSLPAILLDESVGGFGVLVGRSVDIAASPTVELRTLDGRFLTKATRATEVSRPEKLSPRMASESGPWSELGLSRVAELPIESEAAPTVGRLHRWIFERMPSSGVLMILGGLLVTMLVVVPVGISLFAWYARSQRPEANSRNAEWAAKETPPPGARRPPNWQSGRHRGSRSAQGKAGNKAADKTPEPPPTSLSKERRAEIRKMPGATALILQDVMTDLQLTPLQQDKIRQIVDETDGLVLQAEADGHLHEQSPDEINRQRAQLFNASRHRAIRVLTKTQRLQWAEIIR